jgi:hypothetical protein
MYAKLTSVTKTLADPMTSGTHWMLLRRECTSLLFGLVKQTRIDFHIGRQLQTGKGTGADHYNGMLDCFRKIIKNEGYEIQPRCARNIELNCAVSHGCTAESPLLSLWRLQSVLPNSPQTTNGANSIVIPSA